MIPFCFYFKPQNKLITAKKTTYFELMFKK